MKTAMTTEQLTCKLTDAELTRRHEQLVEQLRAIELKEQSNKEAAKADRQELKEMCKVRDDLVRVIQAKVERRPVECRVEPIPRQTRVRVIRTDTGEQVRERAMNAAELEALQGKLPLKDGKLKDGKPKPTKPNGKPTPNKAGDNTNPTANPAADDKPADAKKASEFKQTAAKNKKAGGGGGWWSGL